MKRIEKQVSDTLNPPPPVSKEIFSAKQDAKKKEDNKEKKN